MIPGRTNVGDVQGRRLLAILDVKANKHVWADASAFAGVERKAKPADPDVPRQLNWGCPTSSDDGALSVVAVRSLDNKDRWFVKIDPATGKASVARPPARRRVDSRAASAARRRPRRRRGAWLPDNKRFLFLSEKSGYMHLLLARRDRRDAAGEAAHDRASGK